MSEIVGNVLFLSNDQIRCEIISNDISIVMKQFLFEPRHENPCLWGFHWSDTNQAVQPQKMALGGFIK